MLAEGQPAKAVATPDELVDDPTDDLVLTAPWSHQGTVEAAVVLSGGDGRVKRRRFLTLTGTALTAPTHQWLVHEPEPLISGLSGRRISAELADRLPAMIAELRAMDDVAGCAAAISQARHHVELFESDNDLPWLYWVTPASILVEAGNSLLQLGQADRAAVMLEEGLASFDESFARDRQLYLVHSADALAQPGKQRDLEAAAHQGMTAIELAESLDSTLGVGVIRDLYHRITPHAAVPAVRDLLDRARELVEV